MSVDIPSDPRLVLEIALQNEKTTYDMYQKAGEAATTEISRRTFRFLCEEESRHMKRINEYYAAIGGGAEPTQVEDTHSISYAKAHLRGIFEKFRDEVAKTAESGGQQQLEAYWVAMDIERTGYEFYKAATAQATSEFGKRFFNWLMDEENAHYDLLSQTYTFLKHPDGYLAEMERWMQI